MKESYGKVTLLAYCTVDFLVINGKSNRKVIENYLLLLGSVYYNYLLLEDFDYLLLITGYYFENRSITYYFSITYYLLPHVWVQHYMSMVIFAIFLSKSCRYY